MGTQINHVLRCLVVLNTSRENVVDLDKALREGDSDDALVRRDLDIDGLSLLEVTQVVVH